MQQLATEERYVEQLNGTQLYFEVVGPEDDFQPPLFFLHGGPGYNSYSFRELFGDYLLERTVIYADMRGGGRSGELQTDEQGDSFLDLDTLVADVEAIRQHLELDEIVPLGHGFGALVALEYTRRYAENVPLVLLVNPWLHFPQLAHTLLLEASAISGKDYVDPEAEVRANTPAGKHPVVASARVEAAFAMLNARDLLNALHFKDATSRMHLEFTDSESQLLGGAEAQQALVLQGMWEFEYPPFLFEISRPMYAIAGQHDRTSYPEQLLYARQAGATVAVLDAGHYPWLDQSQEFAEILEQILSK